jgi:cytochrome c oxidase subunit 4
MKDDAPPSALSTTLTLIALLMLASLSLCLSVGNIGHHQMVVALTIATIKASLIASVFMRLAKAPASMRLALLLAAVLTVIFITFITEDIWTRPGHAAMQGTEGGAP